MSRVYRNSAAPAGAGARAAPENPFLDIPSVYIYTRAILLPRVYTYIHEARRVQAGGAPLSLPRARPAAHQCQGRITLNHERERSIPTPGVALRRGSYAVRSVIPGIGCVVDVVVAVVRCRSQEVPRGREVDGPGAMGVG